MATPQTAARVPPTVMAGEPGDATQCPTEPGLDRVLVLGITLLTMVVAAFAVFFLPLYAGSVPLPVSALIGAATVFWAVRTAFALRPSMKAAVLPAVGWLAVTFWLSLSSTLGYGLVIGDWRFLVMLGGGVLTAAVALAGCWSRQVLRSTAGGPSGPDVPGNTARPGS